MSNSQLERLEYFRTAERPALKLWVLDDDGELIDFSSGYTFAFKLGQPGNDATFTKTSGISGDAGSGTESTGDPNVTIEFTADELDDLDPGLSRWQLRATNSSLDRIYQGWFDLLDVIT